MSKSTEKGYWWECSICDKTDYSLKIMGLLTELSNTAWNQQLLRKECPDPDCDGQKHIAFYYNKRKKEVVLLKHVVGISYNDKIRTPEPSPFGPLLLVDSYLPMMWEWSFKKPDNNRKKIQPHFDFKHIDTVRPNPSTLTRIVSLTKSELVRLFELYKQKTGNQGFLQ